MAFVPIKKETIKSKPKSKPKAKPKRKSKFETKEIEKIENPQLFDFAYTINLCAKMLGKDPRTVRKKIVEADLKPFNETKVNGYPVYNLAEVAYLCYANEKRFSTKYKISDLTPKELAEHFMAKKREIEVLTMERELIKYDEAAEKFAELARTFSTFFDTFADDLEQTQLFTLEQMLEIRRLSDDQRVTFVQAEF